MKNASDIFKDMPNGSEFVRGYQADDFDDMGMMRRRVCQLEQVNGDLGETIGALKYERARLWGALNDAAIWFENHRALLGSTVVYDKARETLEQIRIDK